MTSRNFNRISVNTRVDKDLYDRFQALSKSPIYDRTAYGALSELVNQALLEYVRKHEGKPQHDPFDLIFSLEE